MSAPSGMGIEFEGTTSEPRAGRAGVPPLLLGATLLFWGWQTGWIWLGLAAALVLESPRIIGRRWRFAQTDLDRIWNLCVLLFFGSFVVAFTTSDGVGVLTGLLEDRSVAARSETLVKGARSLMLVFEWLPLTLLPMASAQEFADQTRMDWSTFSHWLRRQRRLARPRSAESGLNFGWPYFAACLLATSAANERTLRFTIGLVLLVTWALWARRPRRRSPVPWFACLFVALAMGFAVQSGLQLLQRMLQRLDAALIARLGGSGNYSDKETRTMIGEIGKLKLSGDIVLRVETDGLSPPALLREASYNTFRSPGWHAPRQEYAQVTSEADLTTTILLPKTRANRSVTISSYFSRENRLLALPFGAVRVRDLNADLETNGLGVVRLTNAPGFARYQVAYQDCDSIDSKPAGRDEDLDVPTAERPAVQLIVNELQLMEKSDEEKLQAVARFFAQHFQYTTWLGPERRPPATQTALGRFLLDTRAGHCEYFATATTLLLREARIPARYAVGFAVQEKKNDHWIVRERHAHAWCLAYVDGVWRDVDNTPASWVGAEDERASWWESITDFGSDVWYLFSRWRWGTGDLKHYLVWLLIPLLGFAGWRLMSKKQWSRAKQTAPESARARARLGLDSEFYLIERRLVELGLERRAGETLAAWLHRVGSAMTTLSPAETAGVLQSRSAGAADLLPMEELLRMHYRLRFDPVGLGAEERSRFKAGVAAWLEAQTQEAPSAPGSARPPRKPAQAAGRGSS